MKNIKPSLRAAARVAAVLAWALPLLAAQKAVAGPVFKDYETIPRLLRRGLADIMGIKIAFNGAAAGGPGRKPTIYAANHMSYLDIILLGAVLPGAFVSKHDVRKWPLVGAAAAAIKTIFVERRVGTLRRDQKQIVDTLNSGRDVVLFPEGTTSAGGGLLPFKAGLLCVSFNNVSRAKLEKDIQIQPVSLRITHVDGAATAENPNLRHKYAWFGNRNIGSHFWDIARMDGMRVEITAHEPLDPKDFPDRRAFTRAVRDKVQSACDGPAV